MVTRCEDLASSVCGFCGRSTAHADDSCYSARRPTVGSTPSALREGTMHASMQTPNMAVAWDSSIPIPANESPASEPGRSETLSSLAPVKMAEVPTRMPDDLRRPLFQVSLANDRTA